MDPRYQVIITRYLQSAYTSGKSKQIKKKCLNRFVFIYGKTLITSLCYVLIGDWNNKAVRLEELPFFYICLFIYYCILITVHLHQYPRWVIFKAPIMPWYTVYVLCQVYECIVPRCKRNIPLKSYIFAHKKWKLAPAMQLKAT